MPCFCAASPIVPAGYPLSVDITKGTRVKRVDTTCLARRRGVMALPLV